MKAFLILENGTVYQGIHIGAVKEVICEIVFNTSMAGYVEALTDPAAAGQAVCMTYPLVGNYGVCREDSESGRAWAEGLIVRELSRIAANFRTDLTIQGYLQEQGIFGITGIDTRSLTKLLRINGTMSGCLTTNEHFDLNEYLTRIKAWRLTDAVAKVTTAARYENKGMRSSEEIAAVAAKPGSVRFNNADYSEGRRENSPIAIGNLTGRGKRVAVLDTGIMNSQLEALTRRGCDVTVFPAGTPAEELLAATPDGILLSGGPGDPRECPAIIAEVRKLYEAGRPLFAIGLGHQLLALATGAQVVLMDHGHRGSSHPVRSMTTGKVLITGQNHGYTVDMATVDKKKAQAAFVHVNDGTCEGLKYHDRPILSIQFYPETVLDLVSADSFFEAFMSMMDQGAKENHSADRTKEGENA